jgi:hypothetical protein
MIVRAFILVIGLPVITLAEALSQQDADNFVRDLIWNPDSIQTWFDDDELIASYIASFTIPSTPVPWCDNKYYFSVERTVFEEPLNIQK